VTFVKTFQNAFKILAAGRRKLNCFKDHSVRADPASKVRGGFQQ